MQFTIEIETKTFGKTRIRSNKRSLIIGGDFNGTIGRRGELIWDGNQEEEERKSKDKIVNMVGREILDFIGTRSWGG